ncbi:MAG: hypothetical protein CVU11_14310 [Bacteroidetes bacterium HGW-Bacteroidetes-6]|jgi:PAS domain S-box-containing protein|nr:MAG: hypothetical protein CVU11_14310 [Bacteroidetes bacterium HGW-Bacteroidetes-6]
MNETFIVGLIQNIALLLAFSMLHDFFASSFARFNRYFYQLITGILLGGIGVMLILTPWNLQPGIFFDTRSVMLSVSGLFFGPIPTFIAIAITSVYRYSIGGDGMWMGIAVIISSGVIGIVWRTIFATWNQRHTGFHLLFMGITAHLIMLSCTLLLPAGSRLNVLDNIFIPVLFVYPIAVFLLGQLLLLQRKNQNNRNELATSEQRWKFALDGSGNGVWDWDLKTNHCYFSRSYKAMLGYVNDDFLNDFDEWKRRIHYDDKERVLKIVDEYLKGKVDEYQVEFRMLSKSGAYRWILARGKIVEYNENNEPIRVIGTHTDITERREAEEARQKTESKYKRLLESMMDGFVFIGVDGKITDCNESYCEMLQYSSAELRKFTCQQLTPEKWHELEQKIVDDKIMTLGYSGVYEKEYIKKDGTVFPVELSLFLSRNENGDIEGIWGIVRDISRRKKFEFELYETSEFLESLFNYANAPIVVWDNKMHITRFNKAFEVLSQYSSKEVVGRKIDMLFPPESRQRSSEMISQPVEGKRLNVVEIEIVRKDGVKRMVLWNSANVFDQSKENVIATIAQGHDITDRKKAEDEVRRLNEELERKVTERTYLLEVRSSELAENEKALMNLVEDLNLKTEELEQKSNELKLTNSELEAFSYSVSHDLRAPLRAINNFASILKEEYASKLDDEARRICVIIDENTKRMGKLIDDLLSFSRIGRSDIMLMPIDMNAMVKGAFLECAMDPERVKLYIGKLHSIQADATLIKQVWINLISNAVKFSANSDNPQISVSSVDLDTAIEYSIQDNGAGFDMEYVGKLFGVFQRLHSVKEFEGTGVGLAIVKRIVERHGGVIRAIGEPGKGAEFIFTLPKKTQI